MNDQNLGLEQLFAQARVETPQISFDETKKRFLAATVLAAGGVLATKGIIHLFTKKWIVMTSLFTVATTTAIIATSMAFNNDEPQSENTVPPVYNESIVENEPEEIVQEPIAFEEVETKEAITLEEAKQLFIEEGMAPEIINIDDCALYLDEHMFVMEFEDDTTKDKNKDKCKEKCKDKCKNSHSHSHSHSYSRDGGSNAKIIPYTSRFEITEETTDEELDQIKQKAKDAGISFDYSVNRKKGKITKLDINMNLSHKDENGSRSISNSWSEDEFDENTKFIFGWSENDKGEAVDMGMGDKADNNFEFDFNMEVLDEQMALLDKQMEQLDDQMDLLDDQMEQLDFTFEEGDSLKWIEFGESMEEWGENFGESMENIWQGFEFEHFEKSLDQLDQLNEEIMMKVEQNMEKLEEELEEMFEKLEIEFEKMEMEEKQKEQKENKDD